MKRLESHAVGVDHGDVILFSDFEDDGEMWKGEGPRSARHSVTFSERYVDAPTVSLQMSMIDMSNDAFIRADLQPENISEAGFDIVFRTWGDSRVARIRVAWQAIGPLPSDDTWEL
ncbi:MAG: H-type lectin domain-containing protein [Yoonia sp.]|uniref:H-type lectin domain-containing protein n=1 Tax=Rhodobacterales TaxID=204455 RepID=UPI001FF3DE6D|nr:H-type lectin domain-containing protein [Loktanella sp. F6476L]MCK0119244.1 H-type lectin domain-containing protein [Loktanella sp. F6476L]UWR00576.1 H-type lectin domain-containing protein [Rhodobacteraceae bacterium S2214]